MTATDQAGHREDNETDAPFDAEPGRITEAGRRKHRLTRAVCLLEAAEILEIQESVIAEHAGRPRSSSAERVAAYRKSRRARNEKEVGGVYAPDDEDARNLLRKIGAALISGIITLGDLENLLDPEPQNAPEPRNEGETDPQSEFIGRCRRILGGSTPRRILFRLLIWLLTPRTTASRVET